LGHIPFPLPPLPEQRAIADFLDRKTKAIDNLIQKKQRLIELLREKRQTLIIRAVTKGLDPSVPMKDSGITWLGEIPAHWMSTKIRYEAKIVSQGTTPSTLGRELMTRGVRLLKAENILADGCVSASPEFFVDEETDDLLRRSRLAANDILIVIAGATTGKSAVLSNDLLPANTNQAVCFVRLCRSEYAPFVQAWFSSPVIQEQVWLNAVQAAQPNLSMEDIRCFPCPWPPKEEVTRIAQHIMQTHERFQRAFDVTLTQLDRLREYRQALISAAVTGKIDVTRETA
jgi:type I restriction enzyme S subunit